MPAAIERPVWIHLEDHVKTIHVDLDKCPSTMQAEIIGEGRLGMPEQCRFDDEHGINIGIIGPGTHAILTGSTLVHEAIKSAGIEGIKSTRQVRPAAVTFKDA